MNENRDLIGRAFVSSAMLATSHDLTRLRILADKQKTIATSRVNMELDLIEERLKEHAVLIRKLIDKILELKNE